MDLSNIKIKQDLPYPEIGEANECPRTVGILKDLISGKGGEMNAVLQYIYQSTVADKVDADLGELFEEVGIVCMHHTGLLMHAITDFGDLPKYEDSNGYSFNANCVNYAFKLKDMLDVDLLLTQKQIDNYKQAINLVQNQSLKNLLTRILKDKETWCESLKQLRGTIKFLSI